MNWATRQLGQAGHRTHKLTIFSRHSQPSGHQVQGCVFMAKCLVPYEAWRTSCRVTSVFSRVTSVCAAGQQQRQGQRQGQIQGQGQGQQQLQGQVFLLYTPQ